MNEQKATMDRALGLSSCITITAGAVIGVGLFTTGSSAAAAMGSSTIIATIIAFLMVLWPSMIYGELGATLPLAGGTYAFAKRGINYPVCSTGAPSPRGGSPERAPCTTTRAT